VGADLRLSRRRLLLAAAGLAAAGCAEDPTAAPPQTPPAVVPPAPPSPLPVSLTPNASREFRAVAGDVADALGEARIPGAALGILSGNREEYAAFGVASLSSLEPVRSDTLFQVGSLTKSYTATAVWRLIDQGLVDLDGPVRRYVRGLRLRDHRTAETVTVANLLDHTAGWYGDDIVDTGDDAGALGRYVENRMPELPQLFGCGEFFSYNNSAFQLLGLLTEVSLGTDYNDALQRLVLGPLGLSDTLLDHGAVRRRPYADGHIAMPVNGRDTVAVQTPLWLPRCADPAGGIWSTSRDVLRYARLHLGIQPTGRTPFLRPASLRAMQEPAVEVPGLDLAMGRSWFIQDVDGLRAITHDGDTLGQHTLFMAVPRRRFAFVLLLNGQPGAAAGLAALDAALSRYRGLEGLAGRVGVMRALAAPPEAPAATLTSGQLDDYPGRYADPGLSITVTRAGGGLEAHTELTPPTGSWQPAIAAPPAEGPAAIAFLAPDSAVAEGSRISFVRNGDGDVDWVAQALRLRPRA